MNTIRQWQLRRELTTAGADESETSELTALAADLRHLDKSGKPIAVKRFRLPGAVLSVGFALSGAAIAVVLIVAAQSVLPNSWLFPVQRLSDNAAVAIHAEYRANVMMKRASQVNGLVASHSSDAQVMSALADYTRVARAYQASPHADYAAFEFCETNLNQAATAATPRVRQAINDSLNALRTS